MIKEIKIKNQPRFAFQTKDKPKLGKDLNLEV